MEGLPEGDSSGCWFIKRLVFDSNITTRLNLDIYEALISKDYQTFFTIAFCIIFLILALFLLIIGVLNCYYVIYDTIYTFNGKLGVNPRVKEIQSKWALKNKQAKHSSSKRNVKAKKKKQQKGSSRNSIDDDKHCCVKCLECCILPVYDWFLHKHEQYCNFKEKYLYFDSKYKLVSIMSGEFAEILFQFYGLCLYGGIDLFRNDVILGQEYSIVESFAIIVGLNGIFAGFAWILYVIWHNTWFVCVFVCLRVFCFIQVLC